MQMLITAMLILVPAPPVENIEPKGPAPSLRYVKWVSGNIESTVAVPVQEAYVVNVPATINGQTVYQTVTKVRIIHKTVKETRLGNFTGYDLDGKKIDAAVWQKALEKGATVIMAGSEELPDASYRKLFKEGILILVPLPADPNAPIPVPAINR